MPFVLAVLLLLLCAGIIYELNQSVLRIAHVQMYGADQSYADIATLAMQGKYLGLIPRDSTLFFPASRIRSDIIALHPDIAAVSIFRNGFTGLSIKVSDRVPIARWCGSTPLTTRGTFSSSTCYLFDASGFIFATTSALQPVNAFAVYEPLGDVADPLTSTLPNALDLPSTFDFARQLATLGGSVAGIAIRGDEVDDYLASGTRITYLLAHEQDAFTALVSAQKSVNLADSSIEYVDLRFNGRVYVKRQAVGKP